LDACIVKEVSSIVKQDAPVGERELNEVDRKIGAAVKAARGDQVSAQGAPAKAQDDDVKSSVSKAASAVSRSKSQASSGIMLNPDQQIRMGMQGKVIGMTDAEWTAQVNRNVERWSHEEREKANRLKEQRHAMRAELTSQMQLKQDKAKVSHHMDREKHVQQLSAIEQKLIDDELKNMEHNNKIRTQVSINRQFNQLNEYKSEQARAEREKQNEERRLLDEKIRQANMADARVADERRVQLKKMAEEDRKAKALQKALFEAKQAGRDAEDAVSQVYAPSEQTGAAFDHVRRVQKPEGRSQLLKSVGASLFVGSK
jgi:hypothetical protein